MRYVLTNHIYAMLENKGIPLICKLCNCPLHLKDEIESKPSKYGRFNHLEGGKKKWRSRRKLYHSACYDEAFIETNNNDDEDKYKWIYDAELDKWLLDFEEAQLTFGMPYKFNPHPAIYKEGGSICSRDKRKFTFKETMQLYIYNRLMGQRHGIPRCPYCHYTLRTRPIEHGKVKEPKTSFFNRLYQMMERKQK